MPDYLFAVTSAILWALSVPIISIGINRSTDKDRRSHVLAGLMTSMASGTAALSLVVIALDQPLSINLELALAGLFTFPLATGVYYFSGVALRGRADIAALFSKVKPLFSVALAVLVLHETMDTGMAVSLAFIATGTVMLLLSSLSHTVKTSGVLLGLVTALFWAIGEFFMKRGMMDTHPIAANLSALTIGAILFSPFAIRPLYSVFRSRHGLMSLWPFLLHGVISFGIAYSFFFFSLERIGLGRTILINAFWPILGILITALIRVLAKKRLELHPLVLVAALLLLCGSLLQAASVQ